MRAFGQVRDRALALVTEVLSECRETCLRVAGVARVREQEVWSREGSRLRNEKRGRGGGGGGGGFSSCSHARTEARASSWRSLPSAWRRTEGGKASTVGTVE